MDITGYVVSSLVIFIMSYAAYKHVKQFTWTFRQVVTLLAITTIVVSYTINIFMAMNIIEETYHERIIITIFISFIVYFIARPKNKKQVSL